MRILERLRWGMAQKRLGNTGLGNRRGFYRDIQEFLLEKIKSIFQKYSWFWLRKGPVNILKNFSKIGDIDQFSLFSIQKII